MATKSLFGSAMSNRLNRQSNEPWIAKLDVDSASRLWRYCRFFALLSRRTIVPRSSEMPMGIPISQAYGSPVSIVLGVLPKQMDPSKCTSRCPD